MPDDLGIQALGRYAFRNGGYCRRARFLVKLNFGGMGALGPLNEVLQGLDGEFAAAP
jgi:hypothetical protein